MVVILESNIGLTGNIAATGQLTFKTCSIESSRLTFRIKFASSMVMRCCRVNRSVIELVVAFPTPVTSLLKAPCGECFASAGKL